jgi:hypothetical protein
VILDLRLNLGGNGYLRNSLVRQLIRTEDEDTRLFVLTARGTFSASQFILDDLDRLSNAVFIGEPASSKPSSFGDAYRMPMPNSGISVRSSIYYWQEGQNRDPYTWIDIAAPLTFADYAAGRDPAVEAALAYVQPRPLREQLLAAQEEGGIEAVRAAVRAYWSDPARRYANRALHLLQTAEALNPSGGGESGFVVAQMVAEWEPRNVDAAHVAAHLAHRNNRSDLARVWLKRVLELDPNHRVARSMLEQLEQPTK